MSDELAERQRREVALESLKTMNDLMNSNTHLTPEDRVRVAHLQGIFLKDLDNIPPGLPRA